jgi:hypothetical protein
MSTLAEPEPQPAPAPVETENPMVKINPDPGKSQIIERGDQLDGESTSPGVGRTSAGCAHISRTDVDRRGQGRTHAGAGHSGQRGRHRPFQLGRRGPDGQPMINAAGFALSTPARLRYVDERRSLQRFDLQRATSTSPVVPARVVV